MKKQEQNTKETVSMLVYGYLVILFAGLPLYMQNKLVMIGNAKYLFSGILRWCWGLLWCWLYCGRGSGENRQRNGRGRKRMCLCCCIWCLQSFLMESVLQGGCPFRVSRLVYGAGDPGTAGRNLFCGIPVL